MMRCLVIFLLLGAEMAFANLPQQSAFDFISHSLTNRNGKKWQFQFDAANRLTNTLTPLNRETLLTYDNRGLLSLVKEPSTQTTTNNYDAKGRLTNRVDGVGSVVYRYDANNNITNVIEAGKTNAWTFDAYDRVSTYRDADNNLLQYRYDPNGNLTNLVYPDGKVVTYFYDSLNRLTNVTDWANRKTTYTYDLASRLTSITRPNLTQRTNSYDVAGQATNMVELTAIGFPIVLFRHNWNSNSTMQWEFAAPLPHTNAPPTRTMTYDDDNRLLTVNGSYVTNDLDGNLTYGPLTNGTFVTYGFDARNRLLSAGGLSYGYDPANDRTSITNGTNVTKFIINPNAALSQALVRVKNGVTNYYVYGLGLLYEAYDDGSTRSYHYDYRGSTVALTDGSGNVTDRIEYSAYGSLTYRSGSTDTPFLYNGRYGVQTDANGLLFMRARYYNPYLCRFINADPSGFAGGLNHYAYANGNPISLIDPFGLGTADVPWVNSWLNQLQNMGSDTDWNDRQAILYAQQHPMPGYQTAANMFPFAGAFVEGGQALWGGNPAAMNQAGTRLLQEGMMGLFVAGAASLTTPATTTALSPYRVTSAGETFYHYGYAENAASFQGGLRPGGYATSAGNLSGVQAQSGLALPPRSTPPNAVYTVSPNPGTWIRANPVASPNFGQLGGFPEYRFPGGTSPGTVSPPRQIP